MHAYRIETTKILGGETVRMPILSADDLDTALERFEGLVSAEYDELNAPLMREIGGHTELFLTESDNILLRGDVLRHVTVKRPLHSPAATVHRRQAEQ